MEEQTLSRSERVAMEEFELREWMKQIVPDTYEMNIYIFHREMINMWVTGPINRWQSWWPDFWHNTECQPPWKPTLQDIEDNIDEPYKNKLLKIMNYEAQFVISSLDVEINGDHMKFLRDLCEKFECEEAFDMNDMNDDEEVNRILNLEPRDVFQESNSEVSRQNCKRALEIIEGIMEKDNQQMDQGEYIEMCNLLKELY
tara:strand:+ start:171 stop:770 length:600 start_codon:yes stop_codon:yes gene_type:complete